MITTTIEPKIETSLPVKYTITEAEIRDKFAPYKELSAESPKGYEAVRIAIAHCRDTRGAIEKKRVELKADALAYGKLVDSTAKSLTTLVVDFENDLKKKKDVVDAEKERIKAESERIKREEFEAKLKAEIAEQEAKRKAEQAAEEARIKAIRDAEQARRKAEQEDRDKENARIAKEQKAEQDRLAMERAKFAEEQRIERAKVIAEQEKRDAEIKAERDRLTAERAKIDEANRVLREAKEKADRAEFERVAKIRAKQEADAQAERDRIAKEQAEAKEAERLAARKVELEALRPDLEKIRDYARLIRSVPAPKLKDKGLQEWITATHPKLEAIAASLCRLAEENEALK